MEAWMTCVRARHRHVHSRWTSAYLHVIALCHNGTAIVCYSLTILLRVLPPLPVSGHSQTCVKCRTLSLHPWSIHLCTYMSMPQICLHHFKKYSCLTTDTRATKFYYTRGGLQSLDWMTGGLDSLKPFVLNSRKCKKTCEVWYMYQHKSTCYM